MTHNGTCNNVKGLKHRVYWNFKEPELEETFVRFSGTCIICEMEFQSTYELIGNVVISKKSREVSNFNFEIEEPQFPPKTVSNKGRVQK